MDITTVVPDEQVVTTRVRQQIHSETPSTDRVSHQNQANSTTKIPTAILISGGQQGPKGVPGASAAGVPPIPFSYGDASGVIWTPSDPGTLTLVRLRVLTAFDGVGASIQIGTLSDPGCILAANQNDPGTAEEYENTPDVSLNEAVYLTITPGTGASQGNGTVLLNFVPD